MDHYNTLTRYVQKKIYILSQMRTEKNLYIVNVHYIVHSIVVTYSI